MTWQDDMVFCPSCGNRIEEPGNCVVCPWGDENIAADTEVSEVDTDVIWATEGAWVEEYEDRRENG